MTNCGMALKYLHCGNTSDECHNCKYIRMNIKDLIDLINNQYEQLSLFDYDDDI